tara:strand:- start:25 stop:495 length:471 start_codon:yes stop_codon:yes gene_type:complete
MNIIDLKIKLNIIEEFILRITYTWTADDAFMTLTKNDGTILRLINNRGQKIYEINEEDDELELRRKIDTCEEIFNLFNGYCHPDISLLTMAKTDGNIIEVVNRIPEVPEEVEVPQGLGSTGEVQEEEEESEEEVVSEEDMFPISDILDTWEITEQE